MHDQIRLTVVATGFDQNKQQLQQFVSHPQPVINTPREEPQQPSNQPTQPLITNNSDQTKEKKSEEEDEWDIPAFLRQRN